MVQILRSPNIIIQPWTIVGGNPAKVIKQRVMRKDDNESAATERRDDRCQA